jgi:hypothetical protein
MRRYHNLSGPVPQTRAGRFTADLGWFPAAKRHPRDRWILPQKWERLNPTHDSLVPVLLVPRLMATVSRIADHAKQGRVFFSRAELDELLQLYSRQVMRGVWRDYAIDQRDGMATFSVFRRSLESPAYAIIKTAPGANRHGDYMVLERRMRFACGRTLAEVLTPLRRELRRAARIGTALSPFAPA